MACILCNCGYDQLQLRTDARHECKGRVAAYSESTKAFGMMSIAAFRIIKHGRITPIPNLRNFKKLTLN